MMIERNQFEKPLRTMKFCLFLSGIKVDHIQWHPLIERFVNSFLYYFNLAILYTVIFWEIYWLVDGIQIGRDFVEMSLTAPCITMSILSTLKAVPLYFKRDVVCQIIDTLQAIHPRDDFDSVENDVITNGYTHRESNGTEMTRLKRVQQDNIPISNESVQENVFDKNKRNITDFVDTKLDKYPAKGRVDIELADEAVKMLKTVEFLLSAISVSVLVMFLLAPLLSMYWRYFKTGLFKIKYPFSVKYWFDVYEVNFWPLVYFHQVWATIVVCVNVLGTEILFYTVCTYIEMHFRILSHRFESLQPGPSWKMQQELLAVVRKHQLLIHLVEQTEALFSRPALFHIVSSSFLICLSAFNITVAEEIGSVFAFVTFLSLSLSQVSLLCFFADKLMRSSTEVSGAIYKCPWYEFDENTKKAILIIVMRAQKPCKLTASNFADLNLRAFTTILSRSWSYFALLKTVYN